LNDKLYNYDFSNLAFYEDEDIDNNKELTIIFNFLLELNNELTKQNKEIEKYFVLSYDEEEDEEEIIKKKLHKRVYNKKTKQTGIIFDIIYNEELNKYVYMFEDDELSDINPYFEEDLEVIKEEDK
jgi:hypothetical protein